ncbi:MAG: hypothetical protein WCG21_10410 [Eubacteriales bacterium]
MDMDNISESITIIIANFHMDNDWYHSGKLVFGGHCLMRCRHAAAHKICRDNIFRPGFEN